MENRNPKVISVGSVKHGQGVTTLAYNLAYKLSTLLTVYINNNYI